ncbi:hypothetical protein A3H22_00755 [Candidatus Peribacteria bacterium RIFCSPLOWO2_12_FULL_55_15]|nr:MAG: hypothetical protein A2789_03715 [Candidatus Peribacteria bacterium RIFCSPHIGHO2_01_FULL_54_22]OGJ62740.1 MAG: hypothetical protein A3D12_01630 [Candidatus Peribacteria bacterium RIFCSPHIGHO2_02_FULL_55_24]OGJ64881.1 MAG: hypothetical protein A3E47_03180 [Candidatus Peribacteria bacterium RIFCSPHIGHO2_12_FULL_54_10]OGJ67585.1 MAG: hypothetical protein A2947_02650 [Candidatus Peribacteria bacterium RIFCSPLOWO2_01_FULL_54_110]OGJ69636.1 MAG: hypothetical protein A3H90_03270 [Candidatus Pe
MNMRFFFSLFCLFFLAACGSKTDIPFPVPPSEDAESSADSSEIQVWEPKDEVQQETGNVSYRGVLEPLGISLYMQGTHRLALKDDRFVLLEGPAVDLNVYLGEEVEVFGAARPAVEAGGVIMRVERIHRTTIRLEASSAVSDISSAIPSSISFVASLPSSWSSLSSSSISPLSSRSVSSSFASSMQNAFEQDAKVAMMAKEKFTAEQWTQEYCSPNVGFCVPIHRNWWFKSFGATASSLWHVEVSGELVENLGDGVLLVNLVQGDIATSGATDREVRMHGNFAVGYRNWTENRYFEISAPMDMKDAVQYMTDNLK